MPGEPTLHELLAPISFLVGEWQGEGTGLWPGGFVFTDGVSFSHDGRPMLVYRQATREKDGAPSHLEAGYFIVKPKGQIHATISEPSGVTEVLVGSVEGEAVHLRSTAIGRAPATDNVTSVARRLRLEGESLVLEVDISVDDEPLAAHTRSVLHRVEASSPAAAFGPPTGPISRSR